MYKLVAKTGRGFVVAGATRAGAAPQPLDKGAIENTKTTTKAFTVGDVELKQNVNAVRDPWVQCLPLVCERWCRSLMNWTEMELEVGSGDCGTSPQLARLLTAWFNGLSNYTPANPSPDAHKIFKIGRGRGCQVPMAGYIHIANDVISSRKSNLRQISERNVVIVFTTLRGTLVHAGMWTTSSAAGTRDGSSYLVGTSCSRTCSERPMKRATFWAEAVRRTSRSAIQTILKLAWQVDVHAWSANCSPFPVLGP